MTQDLPIIKCPTCTQVVPSILSSCGKVPVLQTVATARPRYFYLCNVCKEVSNATYESPSDAGLAWQRGERAVVK